MEIDTSSFDPKSFLSEVIWSDALLNNPDYARLVELWKKKEGDLVAILRNTSLEPEQRDRHAHLLSGFMMAVDTLAEHQHTSLKLSREQEQAEEPNAPKKKPIL